MEPLRIELKAPKSLDDLGVRGATSRCVLGGLSGSVQAVVVSTLASSHGCFVVVPDVSSGEALEDDLETLLSPAELTNVRLFRPAQDDDDEAESRADLSERMLQLAALKRPARGDVFIVPAAVLLEPQPRDEEITSRSLVVEVGRSLDAQDLSAQLRATGFAPAALVGAPGEISLRGDIVDVFPYGEKNPLRIEFFDDVVESIRAFDAETQLSITSLKRIAIPLLRKDELRGKTARAILLHERLSPALLVVHAETRRTIDRIEEHSFAHGIDQDRVRRAREFVERGNGIELAAARVDGEFDANLETVSVAGVGGGVESLHESLAALRRRCDRIVVLCESAGEQKRMSHLLAERELLAPWLELRVGHVRAGFQLVAERIAVLNALELLGKPRIHRPRPRKSSVPLRAITNLLELHPGDYLVHQTHGIARFNGMMRMKRDQGEEDFLVLEFDGGTIFYLPAAKIELVQRYVGPSGAPPKLDKIGGKSWASKKAKVKAALEDIAQDLIKVQAAREVRPGAPHPRDDSMILEFESSFPYSDTPDQRTATLDVHKDLDSRRPMDRLICGDVGFGKTEVSVRAAFRVVLGGRQVAMLVPTTLLAEQHYETFSRRFASYPIKIAVLSRFRKPSEQRDTLKRLQSGEIDIVVGTHRLLSKDVAFKDLGLVIVDEEQRFGVKAKESLKFLKSSVDVLTLTATPIPRTLHMALVGLRDISALSTPPPGRRPVKTEIHRFEDAFVRKAILFELDRGGQVFFIHNRIESLGATADRVAALVPTAKITIAHGQMSDDELEGAMQSFVKGEADVLVSTSIVESGLDLPRANTIFVDRPELFGLADLHQLRGRVGRSEVPAHCYLLVKESTLPQDSERRLKAIEELSHLGAGYDISIKDLEIRGAGDLLSAAQSGHILAVGYDLYCRLLAEAVARARGDQPPLPPLDTDVDLGVVAFLPAEYVPDPGQRMEILRRLGATQGDAIEEFTAELRDRFGRIPQPVSNLLAVFALKHACRALGIRRLLYPGDDHVLLELAQPRWFHKSSPFSSKEAAMLSNGLIHVRLADKIRGPDRVLAFLSDRMRRTRSGPTVKAPS